MVEHLRAAGAQVENKQEESEFGRFAWVTDPEGNRIELWQPPNP
jgi:predicted enzyme related to lactoylglutathione lyase